MIRIIMADDHAIVRAGFRALIEHAGIYKVVAECASVYEARRAALYHRPNILVLDISLPGGGLTLLPEVREACPDTAVLVLSMHAGEPYVSDALRRGAAGYVSKGAAADELLVALERLSMGESYLSSDLHVQPMDASVATLSERERVVFLRLAKGETPKQVAFDLGISPKTVYLHRTAIREKLGVHTDLQLHQLALSQGLLG